MTKVLEGLTVVELGRSAATARAGMLMMQAGARVVTFDLPGSYLTETQNTMWHRGKERRPFDGAALDALLPQADALVHDILPGEARAMGLDADTLNRRFPRLIHASIGGWPIGHPKEETPVSDALVLAGSGLLDEQQAIGRDGPVWLRFPLGTSHAGYLAAIGICARLYVKRRTGQGGAVATSLLQGALIPTALLWHRADRPSPALQFGFPKDAGATLFECSDGLWLHTMGQPVKAPTIAAALEAMDPDERASNNARYADAVIAYVEDRGAIEAIFRTRARQQWLDELWASDVPAQPALPMGALFFDEQAQANGNVETVDLPGIGLTRQPGPPMQIDPGQPADLADGERVAMPSPLCGLKVLDLGNFLAGPLAPQLLGDLGAEVIKVEATSGDPLRHADWAFNGCQRNKRAIALALKSEEARPVLDRLIAWADVVHHNQRMPAARKLGFGADAVHAINPGAIYSHVSSYGASGPRKDWPGYDQLFQAAAGWEIANAGKGNRPTWCRFGMMDHLAALASVFATLLAVLRRDTTGKGESVSASLLGASIASLDVFALDDGEIAPSAELDADQMGIGPTQRLFACNDGWIAVDAPAHDAMPDELGEADFASMAAETAVRQLWLAGYPCAQVALDNGQAFLADPANRAAGLVSCFPDTRYGPYELVGLAWQFEDMDMRCDRPPPQLGEHGGQILTELGFDPAEAASLVERELVKQP